MAVLTSPSVLSDLAPTGKLRVGINYGNPVLATRDPGSGELRGVAVEKRQAVINVICSA